MPDSQVIDTTIRNGPYATTNQDGAMLLTRSSTVPGVGAPHASSASTPPAFPIEQSITSATLTLTLKSGLGTSGRNASGHGLSADLSLH